MRRIIANLPQGGTTVCVGTGVGGVPVVVGRGVEVGRGVQVGKGKLKRGTVINGDGAVAVAGPKQLGVAVGKGVRVIVGVGQGG